MNIAWDELQIDATSSNIPIEDDDSLDRMILHLFRQARYSVEVRAPLLALPSFSSEELQNQIARLVTGGVNNRIRFLVAEEQYFLNKNTRLLNLCRQFSSYVKVRHIIEEYREPEELFVVADGIAYIHQDRFEVSSAVVCFNAPGPAKVYTRLFQETWERSEEVAEVFSLGL